MRKAILLAAVVAGCQTARPPGGGSGGAPAGGPDVAVRAELDFSSVPTEGEIGTFEVRIRNAGKRYVLLRDLVQPGLGTMMTWQVAHRGTLEFNANAGEFEYDPARPAEQPRPAFNGSLLCPGEEILFRPKIRLLHLPRHYLLNYFTLDLDDLARNVYFEVRAQQKVRYRRLIGEGLSLALAPKSAPDPNAKFDVASHRTVVYPHAETILEAPNQARVSLDVRLDRQAISLEAAADKVGTTAKDVGPNFTFFATHGAWVLRGPKGWAMVNAQGTRALPETNSPEQLYFAFDTLGGGSIGFALRSPIENRLHPEGRNPHDFRFSHARECPKCRLRLVGALCPACKVKGQPSAEVPRIAGPRDCIKCNRKVDEVHCPTCKSPTMGPEDAYRFVLHAAKAELPKLLRVLSDEKLRIEITSDGKFVIRR